MATEDQIVVGPGLSGTMVLVWGGTDAAASDVPPVLPRHFTLEQDASLDLCIIVLPGAREELGVEVDLVGPGASVRIGGAYVLGGSDRLSLSTLIRHKVPSCKSDQLVCGIAAGESRFSFRGRIVVEPGADGTEAYQTNRNILLSPEADVSTTPQLEIYADDVKCSHGATVGSLGEEERFYMRSRGIPEDEAKVLQMISFISPVLEQIPDAQSREILAGRIETAIRSLI